LTSNRPSEIACLISLTLLVEKTASLDDAAWTACNWVEIVVVTELLLAAAVDAPAVLVVPLVGLLVVFETSDVPEFCLLRGEFAGGSGGLEVALSIVVIAFTLV
jgi:hypothetical protein